MSTERTEGFDLRLYDTMAREKRVFVPRNPERVTMYVCGPTVYNYAHIGNARPVVVFDVLFRLLRRLYGEEAVIYARNITDVDDKINAAAIAQGVPIAAITDRFADIYDADMAALGALPPTIQPRATAHIAAMVDQIGRLIEGGQAYVAEGHVLFSVRAFKGYGKLSGRSLDDMIAGARVEVAPYKRDPADFVLWKPSKPGEPAWPAPWGEGRPGWHTECSAMIESELGPLPIDIHGGGHDLIFPHHENERAQGESLSHGAGYANYWMHNGFLDMSGEKMSKSLGNVVLVHDLLKQYPGEVIRWALLSGHYRSPLDWTPELLEQSRATINGIYQLLRDVGKSPEIREWLEIKSALSRADAENASLSNTFSALEAILTDAFDGALEDDLNTPRALGELTALSKRLRIIMLSDNRMDAGRTYEALLLAGASIGLLQQDPDAWFEGGADDDLKSRVEALIAARDTARQAKDWPAADRIRADLTALNVVVMDGPDGATWRLKDG